MQNGLKEIQGTLTVLINETKHKKHRVLLPFSPMRQNTKNNYLEFNSRQMPIQIIYVLSVYGQQML